MVMFLDIIGIIAKVNRTFSETLGYTQEEIELSPFEQFLPSSEISIYKELFKTALSGKTQYVNTTLLHKSGNTIYIRLNLIPAISEKRVKGIFGLAIDITDITKATSLNKYLAYHDPLTDLPNPRLFKEKLEQEITISKNHQQKLAVMMVDLDRFKYVNDTLGHSIGERY